MKKADIFSKQTIAGGFFKVPHLLMERREELGLTYYELLFVMALISFYPNKSPSDTMVGKKCGFGRTTSWKAAHSLAEKGLLKLDSKKMKNGFSVRVHDLTPLLERLFVGTPVPAQAAIPEKLEIKLNEPKSPVDDMEEPKPKENPEPDEDDQLLDAFFSNRYKDIDYDELMAQPPPLPSLAHKLKDLQKRVHKVYPLWKLRGDFDLEEVEVQLYNELAKRTWKSDQELFTTLEHNVIHRMKTHASTVKWNRMGYVSEVGRIYGIYHEQCIDQNVDPLLSHEFEWQLTAEGKFREFLNGSFLSQS